MALVTAAQVLAMAIPEVSAGVIDTDVETLIDRADSALAAWCDYPVPSAASRPTLESATYVLHIQGLADERRILSLPFSGGRLVSVTSIYDSPDLDYGASDLVASGDYTLINDEGVVLLSSSSTQGAWSLGKRAIKATVVAGWTTSTVPLEVEQALCFLVGHWWRLRKEHGHKNLSAAGVSVGMNAETIPDVVRELMAPWRLIRWPT